MIYDVETHLIQGGDHCPPLVCQQWGTQGDEHMAAGRDEAAHVQARAILEGDVEGQNLKYDMGVVGKTWPDLLNATLTGRRYCTRIAARLTDIEAGYVPFKPHYSLEALVRRYFDLDISADKGDVGSWRLRFGSLDGVPLDKWPEAARKYALQDVTLEDRTFKFQRANQSPNVHAHTLRLTTADIALNHASIKGIGLDLDLLRSIDDAAHDALDRAEHSVILAGLATRDKDGKLHTSSKAIRRLIAESFERRGEYAPASPPSDTYLMGQTKIDAETLLLSEHPTLQSWGLAQGARKIVSGFTQPWLEANSGRVHPEYDLPKETGRVSCRKPNLQQLPRPTDSNREHGAKLRRVLVPDPGFVFVWADYDQAELVSLAQLCLWAGYGDALAHDINDGVDGHNKVGALVLGIGPELFDRANPEHAQMRQDAKGINYGRPGGLGVGGLRRLLAAQGRALSVERCEALLKAHAAAYPDVDRYVRESITAWKYRDRFARVPNPDGLPMLRFCHKPTQKCNTPFQGLVAGCALEAWVDLWRQCGDARDWWPCLFVHDEIVVQCRESLADDIKGRLVDAMKRAAARWMPDVRMGASAKVAPRWTKKGG